MFRVFMACSYGQKLSRLPRKHFDKFTSEILPCYETIWKVAFAFLWDEKFSLVPTDRRDLGDRDNFYPMWTQLSRLAGKLSVYTLQNLHHTGKLYSVRGKTFLHMNRTTLFDLSKCFLGNRDNFCPYEQALRAMFLVGTVSEWIQRGYFSYWRLFSSLQRFAIHCPIEVPMSLVIGHCKQQQTYANLLQV